MRRNFSNEKVSVILRLVGGLCSFSRFKLGLNRFFFVYFDTTKKYRYETVRKYRNKEFIESFPLKRREQSIWIKIWRVKMSKLLFPTELVESRWHSIFSEYFSIMFVDWSSLDVVVGCHSPDFFHCPMMMMMIFRE